MATKQDISDIKKVLQDLRKTNLDLQLRVEFDGVKDLEDRVAALEGGEVAPSKPKEPEPILTCVQCTAEYRESENAEGCCFYHSGSLVGQGWEYKYSCCGKGSRNYDSAKAIGGCVKGKHRSKHHTDYHYSRYVFYMQEQSKTAKEIWLEMDVEDFITNRCEWAEVGMTDTGSLFILAGSSRVNYSAIVTYTSDELHKLEQGNVVAFEKKDPAGWSIKAELIVNDQTASAVRVSIKPASSSVPLVKQIGIVYDENGSPRSSGKVENLSDPTLTLKSEEKQYTVPEEEKEGPVLDPGEDHSVNRKNDYETEISGDCPLKLQQHGQTEVASSIQLVNGKWNNLFSCKVKVTNTSKENVSVADVHGHYMNKEGEWVKCDEVFVGKEFFRDNYEWFDTPNFWMKECSTASLLVRLCIKFTGPPPQSHYDGRRAHSSLPQPLHLRFTFVDQNSHTASLHFEQGNKPLDLATKDKRIKGWCNKKEENLIFWTSADDASKMKRSDATIYYDDNGIICYRPAPNGNGSYTYYMSTELGSIGYQAKSAGTSEFLVEKWNQQDKDTSIVLYALVDLDAPRTYGVKIIVTTATSKTISHCLLPSPCIKATLSINPDKITVKGEGKISWQVSRVSKNDVIRVFQVNGKSNILHVNCKGVIEGESSFKVPAVPGEYEARYYPASLQGQYYGFRHDQFIATARFTVVGL